MEGVFLDPEVLDQDPPPGIVGPPGPAAPPPPPHTFLSLLDPLHRYQKEACLVHQDHHLNYFQDSYLSTILIQGESCMAMDMKNYYVPACRFLPVTHQFYVESSVSQSPILLVLQYIKDYYESLNDSCLVPCKDNNGIGECCSPCQMPPKLIMCLL